MPLEKSKIKNILIISLSNIGDVVLTFPVFDVLKEQFSESQISIIVGPKAESLLKENIHLNKLFIFNKHQPTWKTISWMLELRKNKFDLIIDLRNTAIPFLLGSRYKTSFVTKKVNGQHMREKHLNRLKSVFSFDKDSKDKYALHISDDDKNVVQEFLKKENLNQSDFVVIHPGAASEEKRWLADRFALVADKIISECKLPVVLVGDMQERKIAHTVAHLMNHKAINVCGRFSLLQLSYLLTLSQAVLVNDSAPMHLASYLDVPTMAIFISTDPKKYGPWGTLNSVIEPTVMQDDLDVGARVKAKRIMSEDVFSKFKHLLCKTKTMDHGQ